MKEKDFLFTLLAVLVALLMPCILACVIYPLGKLFLPDGNVVLTPPIRIICTIIMSIIDYVLFSLIINYTSKIHKRIFRVITFILIFIWNCFIGCIWYLAI